MAITVSAALLPALLSPPCPRRLPFSLALVLDSWRIGETGAVLEVSTTFAGTVFGRDILDIVPNDMSTVGTLSDSSSLARIW